MSHSIAAKTRYSETTRQMLAQFLSYCFIGVMLNTLSYILYLIATYKHVEPKQCMTVLYIAGVIASILANRKWTFEAKGAVSEIVLRAGVAYAFGYLINYLLLYWLVDRYAYSHQLVQLVAIGVVAIFLFLAMKFFVFKQENG